MVEHVTPELTETGVQWEVTERHLEESEGKVKHIKADAIMVCNGWVFRAIVMSEMRVMSCAPIARNLTIEWIIVLAWGYMQAFCNTKWDLKSDWWRTEMSLNMFYVLVNTKLIITSFPDGMNDTTIRFQFSGFKFDWYQFHQFICPVRKDHSGLLCNASSHWRNPYQS